MKNEDGLEALYSEVAQRFGALGTLFETLGKPENTRVLMDVIIDGDAQGFKDWVDRVEMPVFGKCAWLTEVLRDVLSTPTQEICYVRSDLDTSERRKYIQIAARHFDPVAVGAGAVVRAIGERHEVAPGPFLDELKANGLVDCKAGSEQNSSVSVVMSPPFRFCF